MSAAKLIFAFQWPISHKLNSGGMSYSQVASIHCLTTGLSSDMCLANCLVRSLKSLV